MDLPADGQKSGAEVVLDPSFMLSRSFCVGRKPETRNGGNAPLIGACDSNRGVGIGHLEDLPCTC